MRNRTLVLIVIALVAAYVVLRGRLNVNQLPWNQGQAGTIFGSGHYGGGQ